MKRSLFTICLSFLTIMAFSQIKVTAPNGDVGVGTTTPTEKLEVNGIAKTKGGTVETTGASGTTLYERTDGAAVLIGAGINGAGFTVDKDYNFDIYSRQRSFIQDRKLSNGTLLLRGKGSNGRLGVNVASPAERLHVNGAIQTSQTFVASDKRLKKDIKTFKYGLNEVLGINPKAYKYKSMNTSSPKDNIGVIAQELQEVAPDLVSTFTWVEEDEEGNVISEEEYLRIDDTSIKWMLVNAIQEQQKSIDSKDKEIEALNERLDEIEEMMENISSSQSFQQVEINNVATLAQNSPNPFNEGTQISYSIPARAKYATMAISNVSGRTIKTIALENVKNGQVEIKAGDLEAGSYTYSLIIDGEVIDTKKMVLTK